MVACERVSKPNNGLKIDQLNLSIEEDSTAPPNRNLEVAVTEWEAARY